ncbi:hypothetical protein HP546_21850 [Pseudomonas sp. CM25]|uniref:hypothetical protein n=1 Tax=unclassified Pseudomonas TaxID=196821 RepID=UPI000DB1E144|nr:hypothetical protein [Pseudomonas sp. CM25]NQD57984.1 hypothetical protein [Pseudomonas sp. CM25]PZQ36527.1 MAG: hypothetical protein DI560_24495 [Pseudomonas putida]
MKAYLKALFFILLCMAFGAGIGEWFAFVLRLDLGPVSGFSLAMTPVAMLAAIPFRKAFAARKEKH